MTSIISTANNTNKPILSLQTWSGIFELVNSYTTASIALRTDSNCLVSIYQSYDGITTDDIYSFIAPASQFISKQVSLYYPYAKTTIFNSDITNQTFISATTKWSSVLPLPLQISNVSITGTSNVIVTSGSLSLASGSNTIGSVGITPVLNSAQLRNLPLIVGHWYQVASVGDTIGAVWASMGAIIGGESLPPIGREFQCLYPGYGTGTCYDITSPTNTISILQTSTNSGVRVNPTATSPVRTTGLGNTAQLISSTGILYGSSMINKSPLVNCWVKLYDTATAPTATDTPFLIQYLEFVAQYNLISHNDTYFNMPIVNNLWARATLLSTDIDTTDTGINCEITSFIGSPYI